MLKTLLVLTITTITFMPLWALAEKPIQSCDKALSEENLSQNKLEAFANKKSQLQKEVTELYQELLLCQDIMYLSKNQRRYCNQLKKEGRKKVQDLIHATTSAHHESTILGRKKAQRQASCPIRPNPRFSPTQS